MLEAMAMASSATRLRGSATFKHAGRDPPPERLIDDLFELAQLDAGRIDLQVEPRRCGT